MDASPFVSKRHVKNRKRESAGVGQLSLRALILFILVFSACTPSAEERVAGGESVGSGETSAPQKTDPAEGYEFADTDLPDDGIARILGSTVTAPQLTKKLELVKKTFITGHGEEDTVRMGGLLMLLDELVVEDRLINGKLGLEDDPRVKRMEVLFRQFYLARRYRTTKIRPSIKISDAEVESYLPRSQIQIRPRALVLGATPEEKIREEAAAGTPFADLVVKHSRFGGGFGQNGDLGLQIKNGRGYFSRENEEYLWNLPIGEISRPIETEIGPMLVVVEEHVPIDDGEWNSLRQETRNGLARGRMATYLDAVVKRHDVVIDTPAIKKIAALFAEEDRYSDAVVGKVDEQEIWFHDLDRISEVSYVDTVIGASADQIYNNAVVNFHNMSKIIALAHEAESVGITVSEVEEGHVANSLRRALIKISIQDIYRDVPLPTAEDIAAYYKENEAIYAAYDQAHLKVVLVDDLATAMEVRENLLAGADFAAMAVKYSLESRTRRRGGDMGFVPLKQLPPDLAIAIADAEEGDILPISANDNRYSVLQLVEKGQRAKIELDQKMSDSIARRLRKERRAAAIQRFLRELRAGERVELDRAALERIEMRSAPPGASPHGFSH